jgi:hypothetical protein
MHISKLWVTQRKLRDVGQVPTMVEAILNNEPLPLIELVRHEDGSIHVDDGHHRLTAYWLSGRSELLPHEYILLEKDRWRPRFGHVFDLIERIGLCLAG